jgi:S1-C subfamily serine protease
VRSTSYFTAKAGFRRGDIVTAMDGVQVSTPNQSHVLYERSFDRPIKYTVWRVDGYITIEAPLRTYDYGVDLEPYNAN